MNPTPADQERLDNELARQKNDHLPEVADGTMSGSITVLRREPDPMDLVRIALQQGKDPNAILDFIERVNKTRAAEKFAAALAKFQAECPQILKDRIVRQSQAKGGGEMYKFASYDDILKAIHPLLKECGIVISFTAPKIENQLLTGTCTLRVGSHTQDTTIPLPIPQGMNTNNAQNFGMALTYMKRYLLCFALNIVVTDNLDTDDDGASLGDFLTAEMVKEVSEAFEKCKEAGVPVSREPFFTWLSKVAGIEITCVEKIPQRHVQRALDELARKLRKAQEQQEANRK